MSLRRPSAAGNERVLRVRAVLWAPGRRRTVGATGSSVRARQATVAAVPTPIRPSPLRGGARPCGAGRAANRGAGQDRPRRARGLRGCEVPRATARPISPRRRRPCRPSPIWRITATIPRSSAGRPDIAAPCHGGRPARNPGSVPTRLCELRGLRQLRGHLPLAREDRGQSSRRPVGGVLLLAVRRAQLGDDRPGERRQRQRPVMGMRGALLLLPNGKVASLAGFRYRRGCAASDPSHVAPRSLVLAASLVRSDLWLTQREVRLAGIVWCSQRGDCSAVRSYRQSRRRYEAGGIY